MKTFSGISILLMSLVSLVASAQMSESPVGRNLRGQAPTPRYIPPPPAPKPIVKRIPIETARPEVQAPAPVQAPRMVQARMQSQAASSYRPTRKMASNTLAAEPIIPRARSTVAAHERRQNSRRSNWVVSGFYNLAKQTSYTGSTTVQGQNQSYSATESSAPGLGLAGAYVYRPARGFGFTSQLAFEYGRTATALSGDAGGRSLTSDYGGGYTTHTLIGAANGSYSINRFSFYGGINYPYIMGSDSVQLTGLPGYQIGAGSALTRNLGIHVEYRLIRMKGSLNMPPTRLEVEEARMPGFILSVDYSL